MQEIKNKPKNSSQNGSSSYKCLQLRSCLNTRKQVDSVKIETIPFIEMKNYVHTLWQVLGKLKNITDIYWL